MKKKKLLFGVLSLGALVALASCGNDEELENLKKEVTTLKEENDSLKNDKDTLNQNNKKLSDEKTEALALVEQLEQDKKTISEELGAKESAYDNLQDNYDNLEEKEKTLWDDVKTILASNNAYGVKVTDPLGNSIVKVYDSTSNIDEMLKNNFDAVVKVDSYGLNLKSLYNFTDPNWYVAIYENGVYSQVGFGDLVVNIGDLFEFKYECWNTVESGFGTLDEYDVLVDKALYNYYVSELPNKLTTVDTFTGSTYWDSLALYKLKNAQLYGANAYSYETTVNNPFSYEFLTTLNGVNQSELTGNDLFKYYYSDRLIANDRNYADLKANYQSYLDTLTSYTAWGEYSNPFHTGVAKTLGLNLNNAIMHTSYRADTTYGPEGLAWELTGLACHNPISDADLSGLTIEALDNQYIGSKDVALSTYMLAYAASNRNFRNLKDSNGVDAIKYLFDNFYDLTTMKFDTEKLSNDVSSNQIYAGLVAYKLQRDSKYAQNLFE